MSKGYYVKTSVYLSREGKYTRDRKQAQLYTDFELAKLAADISDSSVIPVVTVEKNKKASRKNQSWMNV